MFPPRPFKLKCQKCGHAKLVKPRSDSIDLRDFINTCPKCQNEMQRVSLNTIEKLFVNSNFFKLINQKRF